MQLEFTSYSDVLDFNNFLKLKALKNGFVTVAEAMELVGIATTYSDTQKGWTSVDLSVINVLNDETLVITLPEPREKTESRKMNADQATNEAADSSKIDDRPETRTTRMDGSVDGMLTRAKVLAADAYNTHLSGEDDILDASEQVYIVTYSYILGNFKALLSTVYQDDRVYEVTYNKEEDEYYVDIYKKELNVPYPGSVFIN